MSVFLVVGGAAVALVRRHAPLFNSAQNQAGLNITLRNAVAQLQMEVVNAGTGYSASSPVPFWPVGMTITPATDNTCKGTRIYTSACYDTLVLIDADTNVPALAPSDAGGNPVDTTKTQDIFLSWPGNPAGATTNQYDSWAASLKQNDEIMLIQGGTDMVAGQPAITVVVLAQNAVRNGNAVQIRTTGLTQTITAASKLCPGATVDITGIPPAQDPMKIYDIGECLRFTGAFNPGLDYGIKLRATTYSIDTVTDATNPKLVRTAPDGTVDVIAEQIVGFNVSGWSSNTNAYSNNPADYKSDWASLRSLQIQLVARATPNSDNASSFQNSYDQGPYQVQGMSVVINPRNLNTN